MYAIRSDYDDAADDHADPEDEHVEIEYRAADLCNAGPHVQPIGMRRSRQNRPEPRQPPVPVLLHTFTYSVMLFV